MNYEIMTAPLLLVGIDFSEPSAIALVEARSLARLLQARVAMVHVVTDSPMKWHPGSCESAWMSRMSVGLEGLMVRSGRPWSELSRVAEETGATAVVVGSHGASGYQPLALGSNVRRLSLIAPCPIIIVGPGHPSRRAPGPVRASGEHQTL
jgi:nucleotide-binding universal stress UspA family protein